jgi:capsule biosynthesis protein GfcC
LIIIRLAAISLGAAASVLAHASPALDVELIGSVRNPGPHTFPDNARLSDAALAAAPDEQSYMLGAAWLRNSEAIPQTRLKTGILFDLELLRNRESTEPDFAEAAIALAAEISSMPVTGRIRQVLEPRSLEMDTASNHRLADGDKLYYPVRPSTITVLGAVERRCSIQHRPLEQPTYYARKCQTSAAASKDNLFVIQPDGMIERLGIALWNRSPQSTLAPGGIVFVPLDSKALLAVNPQFNEEAARFLATQVLDTPGALK